MSSYIVLAGQIFRISLGGLQQHCLIFADVKKLLVNIIRNLKYNVMVNV